MTSCYGTYTPVGVNIKREMVLSPNHEEVAYSSIKHTQFKTRVHKPYPISDQNGKKNTLWRGTYLYSLYKGLPSPARKTRCRLRVSLFTQARLIKFSTYQDRVYNVEVKVSKHYYLPFSPLQDLALRALVCWVLSQAVFQAHSHS